MIPARYEASVKQTPSKEVALLADVNPRQTRPLAIRLHQYHIKAAGWHAALAQQVVPCGKDNPLLLEKTDAGRRTAMGTGGTTANLDKDSGTVRGGHDEVDLAAAAPRASIIVLQEVQTLFLQVAQCLVFGGIAGLLGGPVFEWWFDEGISIVSASYSSARAAASEAAAEQHYPQGALYVVATPIGNLADITLRALHVLELVDVIACEDTRHTQQMLRAYGIDKTGGQLLAVHQHNETEAAQTVIAHLRQGKRGAYVSDAGTPGVSDPGARLAAVLVQQGLRCIPLPGASSVTTLLSVAGIGAESGAASGFNFQGFLSSKSTERAHAVQLLAQEARAVILLEAPHRIEALAEALAALGERPLTIGRELTKQFEEIATVAAQDFKAWLAADANRLRGEFALLLHPAAVAAEGGEAPRILALLLAELPLKTAVKLAAEITGQPRNALYEQALALKADKAS
jgi:16S rRNA (cytidine1402-2'-O)-methyltransferase